MKRLFRFSIIKLKFEVLPYECVIYISFIFYADAWHATQNRTFINVAKTNTMLFLEKYQRHTKTFEECLGPGRTRANSSISNFSNFWRGKKLAKNFNFQCLVAVASDLVSFAALIRVVTQRGDALRDDPNNAAKETTSDQHFLTKTSRIGIYVTRSTENKTSRALILQERIRWLFSQPSGFCWISVFLVSTKRCSVFIIVRALSAGFSTVSVCY